MSLAKITIIGTSFQFSPPCLYCCFSLFFIRIYSLWGGGFVVMIPIGLILCIIYNSLTVSPPLLHYCFCIGAWSYKTKCTGAHTFKTLKISSPALGRWRQEDQEFKASLGDIERSCLKNPRARDIAQWDTTCLACTRPCFLALTLK
jgi:hypothetical protein